MGSLFRHFFDFFGLFPGLFPSIFGMFRDHEMTILGGWRGRFRRFLDIFQKCSPLFFQWFLTIFRQLLFFLGGRWTGLYGAPGALGAQVGESLGGVLCGPFFLRKQNRNCHLLSQKRSQRVRSVMELLPTPRKEIESGLRPLPPTPQREIGAPYRREIGDRTGGGPP